MLDLIGESGSIALIGLGGGIVLGLAARLGRFCTLGMIEDAHYGRDLSRLWMWGLALGVALMANFAADAMGLVALQQTFYLQSSFSLIGAALGGLLFGYGMAQAGNCGYGMLARLGGGDLRALVIAIVMGISAYAMLSGPLAMLRTRFFPVAPMQETEQGWAHLIGAVTGLPAFAIAGGLGLCLVGAAAVALLRAARHKEMFWATMAGLAITSGFVGTAWVAAQGFEPWAVQSHSFTAAVGDTIRYTMFASGLNMNFAIGSVLGVVIGASLGSVIRDGFRWEACDDPRELRRQMGGAVLMGVGAVLAAGCSVGQGLSALSLLAFHAPLVMAMIWLGGWLGLRHLIEGVRFLRQA